jgi:hypothetical protein
MQKLKLDQWSNIAEIIAAIAVSLSLVFVAFELQRNTSATEAATREQINAKDVAYLSLRLDSSVLAQALSKWEQDEDLTTLEASQLMQQEVLNFMIFEHSYYQFQKGNLEADEWARHENIIRVQLREYRYASEMWDRFSQLFTPEFFEIVDAISREISDETVGQ